MIYIYIYIYNITRTSSEASCPFFFLFETASDSLFPKFRNLSLSPSSYCYILTARTETHASREGERCADWPVSNLSKEIGKRT